MATYTNQTKHVSTETNSNFSVYATWDSTFVTWDSALFAWDAFRGAGYTIQAKNTSVETNQVKN